MYEELLKRYGNFHRDTMEAKDNLIIDYINNNQREIAMKMAEEEYLARLKECDLPNQLAHIMYV